MSGSAPATLLSARGRQFACFPAAVLAFVVNDRGELLLLAHPREAGAWEVISGAMKDGETVLEAVLRETREEAGSGFHVRPIGTLHAYSYRYDAQIPHMISIAYLLAHEDGAVAPGDDMAGATFRWWRLDQIRRERPRVVVPHSGPWLLERAIELHGIWRGRALPELTGGERH